MASKSGMSMRNPTILHGINSGKDLVQDQVLLSTVCLMSYGANHLLHGFLDVFYIDLFKVFRWIREH